MNKFWQFILVELAHKPTDSYVQMLLGGLLGFTCAFALGPYYGCGPHNYDLGQGAMSCLAGSMSLEMKAIILLCIVFASVCCGRAMSLLQKRIFKEE